MRSQPDHPQFELPKTAIKTFFPFSLQETEVLEEAQSKLRAEIEALQQEKSEIELLLQVHRASCTKGIPATMSSYSPPHVHIEQPRPPSNENTTTSMQPPPPPAISVHSSGATLPEPKRTQAGLSVRPVSLPFKTELTQLDLTNNLALPTPSPSKLVFNFDHSGLTPTGNYRQAKMRKVCSL